MSEEQNVQNEKQMKIEVFIALVVLSLVFSIAALTLSILNSSDINFGNSEAKKVVISKQYDKGRSLDKALATGKPVLAFFYTDWCGFCQRFAPTFNKITKDKRIKQNFAIAFINCERPDNRKHVEKYQVKGFPTVYVIKKDGSKVQLDNNTFFGESAKTIVADRALEIIGE